MFLKSLIISSNSKIIREISFHKGINLIVDETPSTQGTETGNNVGKTTVLMLIDFCLGAKPKNIYTDPENGKEEYRLVKEFLVNNNVLISLILKEDLDVEDSLEVCIERNFLTRKAKIQRIDGEQKKDEDFEEALTDILFPGHFGKKPTFRQIISHNIRYKDLSLSNTLKTLDRFTSDAEYETLYLFLLGCDFDQGDDKQALLTKIRIEQTFKDRLEKDQTKSTYETALAILEGEIEQLNRRRASFNLNTNFENDLENLNQIKYLINRKSSDVGKLNIRRELILEAKEDLEQSSTSIDVQQLKHIYQQAGDYLEGIQKTFEDLCSFHNRMISEKIAYISKDLPIIENSIKASNSELNTLLQQEQALTKAISQSDSFEEIEKITLELNEKFKKKGEYDNIIQQLNEVEGNLKKLDQQLDGIDELIFSEEYELKVKDQVNIFNKYFASISKKVYGEQYALKAESTKILSGKNKGRPIYKFSAFNTNFSSGKKQGEISCFDIAYTQFADEENIPCFHFLLNDKKELMHDNQLVRIANLVNENGIQFVASILKDKLPTELNREEYFVVKLSQKDKLFRIESS